jgi:hypothetical protein
LISDFKDAINADIPVLSELEIKQEEFEVDASYQPIEYQKSPEEDLVKKQKDNKKKSLNKQEAASKETMADEGIEEQPGPSGIPTKQKK